MNVYKVNELWIAAASTDDAFHAYMEETDGMSHALVDDLKEGEQEVIISIKRLTTEAMNVKSVPCCEDGCDECEELDEKNYYTYQELIDLNTDFPRVLAKEF